VSNSLRASRSAAFRLGIAAYSGIVVGTDAFIGKQRWPQAPCFAYCVSYRAYGVSEFSIRLRRGSGQRSGNNRIGWPPTLASACK
jgi:hypothetical protein